MEELTFSEQVLLELITAMGTALFVTLGGGAAAWFVTSRSQESKERHALRTELLQQVVAVTRSLADRAGQEWDRRTSTMQREFGLEPREWVGDSGEAVYPTGPEQLAKVRARLDDKRKAEILPAENDQEKFRRWVSVDSSEMNRDLLSIAVLEARLRAYYGSDSSTLRNFRLASRTLLAQKLFVTSEFTPGIRAAFTDVLGDTHRVERFGFDGYEWLTQQYEPRLAALIDDLLTERLQMT